MESIDKYFGEIYYIGSTLSDEKVPTELKRALRTDLAKCMVIGSTFLAAIRYMLSRRFYLFKNYVNSVLLGSVFGVCYSPLFLGPKIDQHRLNLLLEEDEYLGLKRDNHKGS